MIALYVCCLILIVKAKMFKKWYYISENIPDSNRQIWVRTIQNPSIPVKADFNLSSQEFTINPTKTPATIPPVTTPITLGLFALIKWREI